MSWFSILPEPFVVIETWAIRFFLLLGFLSIGPWVLLIIYDAFLYLFRTSTYEIPYIGGRARSRPRPRAPSLSERPSGKPRRRFSLTLPGVAKPGEVADKMVGLKNRWERSEHERNGSAMMNED
ncbi:hypothetical protein LSUE1_G006627 [Lachnellula suecica]|uniref:Uncharacterized protein n=1 Tax=Lachnellula suecica TaxID=602035 RepID=A0A8T9C297_9HELO|nr:hypothetical protein LSUE1_G006627 [Lachnellula suecica]